MQTEELHPLRQDLSLMARTAETIFEAALEALDTRDERRAKSVIAMDRELDALEIRLDAECLRLLTLGTPPDQQLRYILSVVRTIRDLERIGDESKSVARWSRKLSDRPPQKIMELGQKATEALRAAVRALLQDDLAAAQMALDIEYAVDAIEDEIMASDPTVPLAFIAKCLERIGDLATNIAENVIFYLKADDIRHGGFQQP